MEWVAEGKAVYDEPQTAFVASFVGENNSFAGPVSKVTDGMGQLDTPAGPLRGRIASAVQGRLRVGDRAMLFVRPEALFVGDDGEGGLHGPNML